MILGRKRLLDKDVCEKIKEALSSGLPDKDACIIAGISDSSFYNWLQEAESLEKSIQEGKITLDENNDRDRLLLLEFLVSVKKGRASFKQFHLDNIKNKSSLDWKASAWALERRDPDNFKDRSRESLDVKHSGVIEHKNIIEFLLSEDKKDTEK